MPHESIKSAFSDAVNQIADNISLYAVHPAPDWNFSIWYGSKYSIRFRFNQQRAKLKPETLEAAFYQFDSSVLAREKTQTIVALPWMALPLLFSANLLFHLPNILFPRGVP